MFKEHALCSYNNKHYGAYDGYIRMNVYKMIVVCGHTNILFGDEFLYCVLE